MTIAAKRTLVSFGLDVAHLLVSSGLKDNVIDSYFWVKTKFIRS